MTTPQPDGYPPRKRRRLSARPSSSHHDVASLLPNSQGSQAGPQAVPPPPLQLDCSTPSPISYQYHANIMDTIVTFAAPQTLLALRATCHDLRISVERSLFGMVVEGHAVACCGGWRGSFYGVSSRTLSLLYSMSKAASLLGPVAVLPTTTSTLSKVTITVNGEHLSNLLIPFRFRILEVVVLKAPPHQQTPVYIPKVTEVDVIHWPVDWTGVNLKAGPHIWPLTRPILRGGTDADYVAYIRRFRNNRPTLSQITMILQGPAVDGTPEQLNSIVNRTFYPLIYQSVRFSRLVVVGLDSMFHTAGRETILWLKHMIWHNLFRALRRMGEMPRRVTIHFISKAEWYARLMPINPRPEPRPPPALETLMGRLSLVD
ncbi:uncharacterized protein LOC62_07G009574 [Vanrija pseudolonga]|uniref:Uncharacterized protein n=1 Tax=Vanrija pseudolonga TaxID=143232 RepID=A0AAF1BQF9_9TREE|nr:hypothetical protein LOC62_07G009574 [Vanrija pseudolonga]